MPLPGDSLSPNLDVTAGNEENLSGTAAWKSSNEISLADDTQINAELFGYRIM
jgi:hypothetical protein